LTVDAQRPPRVIFSITEKDVGRAHVPAPVLVDSGNVRLTRVRIPEQPIAPGLLLRERMISRLDVHRIVWIRDLVIPKLGTILPRPRVLQKPSEFSSRGVELVEERKDIQHQKHRNPDLRTQYRNQLRR
jgi:hypothetical protein